MIRGFLLFWGLIYATCATAQVKDTLHHILSKKDFMGLKTYADSSAYAYWYYLRDIAPGYQEGILFAEQWEKDKEDTSAFNVDKFRVTIITGKDSITLYTLSIEKYRKEEDGWSQSLLNEPYMTAPGKHEKPEQKSVLYYETLSQYRDSAGYSNFKKSFEGIFRVQPKEDDFFLSDITYGRSCGFGGGDPAGKKTTGKLVENKQKAELVKWLQSANTEKQAYAVDGLHQLKRAEVKLTKNEIKMIEYVRNKKGNMRVCSGCIYFDKEIDTALKGFKF